MNYNNYIEELQKELSKIDKNTLSDIEKKIIETIENNKSIYLLGNGGNCATASHWVCDFDKGIGMLSEKPIKIFNLSDNIPLITAYANDISYDDIYFCQLKKKLMKDDLIIVLSVSGNSSNLIKAAKYANDYGVTVISIVGNFNGDILKYSDMSMIIYSKNYGIVEDIQLSLGHVLSQSIKEKTLISWSE